MSSSDLNASELSRPTDEKHESLWWLALPPAIWVAHFLATYITAAVFCARAASRDLAIDLPRLLTLGYTIVALNVIFFIAWRNHRRHQLDPLPPYSADTPLDRHRFLAYTQLLLSGLSILGVLFVSLPMAFFWSCR